MVARIGGRAERRRGGHEHHEVLKLPSEQVGRGRPVDLPPAINRRNVLDGARVEGDVHRASPRAEARKDLDGGHELSAVGAGDASLQLRTLLRR